MPPVHGEAGVDKSEAGVDDEADGCVGPSPDAGPAGAGAEGAAPDGAGRDLGVHGGRSGLRSLPGRVRAQGPAFALLAAAMAVYVVVFGWLTWNQQRSYGTFGFDMGIHDQGTWLLSRFKDPYVTVVGRNYLGHHLNLIAFAYVPFYWLGAGPKFLYLTETMALAAGAVPVYLLARDQLRSRWHGAAFGVAYLLHPTIQWINWWHYHPDAFMITPLLFAWWFATRQRWRAFAICCVLALCAKEDAATAVTMMGVVLLVRHWRTDRRVGAFTILGGAAWFVLASKILMPWFNNGELAFYEDFFPGLGSGLGEILVNALQHPSRIYDPLLGRSTSTGVRDPVAVEAFREDIYRYYQRLLVPMSVFALRKPMLLLVAVPMLVINVQSSLSYTHDAKFHYSSIIVVAVVLAAIDGVSSLRSRSPRVGHLATATVLGFALVTNVMWSPSPLNDREHHSGVWARPWGAPAPVGLDARDAAIDAVPSGAGVAATYAFVPHLTHRETIYEFPNPWWVTNWLDCKTSPDAAKVDWLVIDTGVLGRQRVSPFGMTPFQLFQALTAPGTGEFETVREVNGIVVARRVQPASIAFDSPRPKCERAATAG
jgi:uncharacterized membrane protein